MQGLHLHGTYLTGRLIKKGFLGFLRREIAHMNLLEIYQCARS